MSVKVTEIKIDTDQSIETISQMDPTTFVIVRVSAEKYMDEGIIQHLKYGGPLQEVLSKIVDYHSYAVEEESSCEDILKSIIDTNGDGCDYIVFMEMVDTNTGEVVRVI